jgi:hypothetical protein
VAPRSVHERCAGEVGVGVEEDGAGKMRPLVRDPGVAVGVPSNVDDDEARASQASSEPAGVDEVAGERHDVEDSRGVAPAAV